MATANTVNVEMSVSDYEYIRKLTNIRKITANEFNKMGNEVENFQKRTNSALGKTTKNFNTFSGQFGYQAQDLIVQIQGGQNAMLALGQQSSQLLSVINPLYGLFAVLATTAGSMAYQMFSANEEAGDLNKTLTEQIKGVKELTSAQREFLGLQLKEDLKDLVVEENNLKYAVEQQRQVLKDAKWDLEQYSTFTDGAAIQTSHYQRTVNEAEKELVRLEAQLDTTTQKVKAKKKSIDELDPSVKAWNKSTSEAAASFIGLSQSLALQIEAVGKTEIEQAKLNARIQLGTGATKDQITAIDALIDRLFALRTAQANKTYGSDSLYFAISEDEIEEENAIIERERKEYEAAQRAFKDKMLQLDIDTAETAEERLQAQLDKELQYYKDQLNERLISKEQYKKAEEAIEKKYNEKEKQLEDLKRQQFNQGLASDIDSIGAAFGVQFNLSKNYALAEALIDQQGAIMSAWNDPTAVTLPQKIAGAAAAGIQTAAILAQMYATNFSQAHGGIDSVPDSMDNTTFLLKAGERVVQPKQNEQLSEFLVEQKKNGYQSGSQVINQTNNFNNGGKDFDKLVMNSVNKFPKQVAALSSKGGKLRPNQRNK